MKLKYCRSDLKPPKALLEAVKVPDPLIVAQFVSRNPDLVWADHLFLAACRVPGYHGHGGSIPDSKKAETDRCKVVSLLLVTWLLGNDAFVDTKNCKGLTPLDIVRRVRRKEHRD